jgi:uncharacterized Tic20 family protein
METKSLSKIYFNIFISLLFVLLGIYLISKSSNENEILGIPYEMLIGVLGIIVNSILGIKWIFILLTSKK